MSFRATAAVWAARDELVENGAGANGALGGVTLLVALAMADRANKSTGELRAGMRGVSKRTGLAYSTVQGAVGELVGAGVLEVLEQGSGRRAARYRIAIGEPIINTPVDDEPSRSSGRSQQNGLAIGPDPLAICPARVSDLPTDPNQTVLLEPGEQPLAAAVENSGEPPAEGMAPAPLEEVVEGEELTARVAAARATLNKPSAP